MKRRTFLGLMLGAPAALALARLNVQLPAAPAYSISWNSSGVWSTEVDGYYAGRTLIAWAGPLQHEALRIVDYKDGVFRLDGAFSREPSDDDSFVIV